MNKPIKKIVIVGGGSAGWLTAGCIAAKHMSDSNGSIEVILIESPDVKSIGVGEGTWPSMRNTLEKIGINEKQFIQECDASFKQGSKFIDWTTNDNNDSYYHPFMTPDGYNQVDLHQAWQASQSNISFADAVNVQSHICAADLAPKQIATPDYAAVTNYGYHLDAKKFADLLSKHCTTKLNVNYVLDHMVNIISEEDGDITAIETRNNGQITGDLFIDCTGSASLLLGKHYGVKFLEKKHILFNDSAIATQVPHPENSSNIASTTNSTAQSSGWIWDIALPSRRGVGYTYSSKHINDIDAETELRRYIANSIGAEKASTIETRKITFQPGHREKFWYKNCLAIGMSSGFLEPLEASALAMVELSCNMLTEEFPVNKQHMKILAKRFNERFTYRWERTIEFLKLHYVISKRTDSSYWVDNKLPSSIPDRLQELLELWQYQPPNRLDFIQNEEIFPSASYQYILYGMKFITKPRALDHKYGSSRFAIKMLHENKIKIEKYKAGLPSNRELINAILGNT
ncbi:tryptophan halogenase family protein [Pseudocolwellia sp. HL-MZ19]|uniref:tryptophan halogenase family protein n=1 Tax=Pseudocolwellia sp. HL-MZ19 TaxID=3400846 RepID=UPI003CF9154C